MDGFYVADLTRALTEQPCHEEHVNTWLGRDFMLTNTEPWRVILVIIKWYASLQRLLAQITKLHCTELTDHHDKEKPLFNSPLRPSVRNLPVKSHLIAFERVKPMFLHR